jgi:hypothetical protein
LEEVQKGTSYGVLYGKNRRPVAKIVPYDDEPAVKVGLYEGQGSVDFTDDWSMTPEELLSL